MKFILSQMFWYQRVNLSRVGDIFHTVNLLYHIYLLKKSSILLETLQILLYDGF